MKSTVEEIRRRFDADVERFSNLETGQSATVDAPLAMALVAEAAAATTPKARHVLDVGCGAGNYTLKLLESLPNLGAIASSFSISSFVGGSAVVAPSASGTPTSKNICSSPAGATEISILADLPLSFLNECSVPTGILANIPAVATRCSAPIWNVISPSRR